MTKTIKPRLTFNVDYRHRGLTALIVIEITPYRRIRNIFFNRIWRYVVCFFTIRHPIQIKRCDRMKCRSNDGNACLPAAAYPRRATVTARWQQGARMLVQVSTLSGNRLLAEQPAAAPGVDARRYRRSPESFGVTASLAGRVLSPASTAESPDGTPQQLTPGLTDCSLTQIQEDKNE